MLLFLTPKYAIITYPQICYYFLPLNMLLLLTLKYAIITYPQICYYYPQICYYYLPPNMLLLLTSLLYALEKNKYAACYAYMSWV